MTDPADSPRRKIKQIEAVVARAVRETPDTTTLVLYTGNDALEYAPGHFLTIDPHQFPAIERFTSFLEDQKGRKEPPRAYSLASAPHERHLAVTVKEERYVRGTTRYPPLLSPLLVRRTPPGCEMLITGFTGPYTLPENVESVTDHIVHVCAGSGIVPNYSILKHALREAPKLRHTLVYSNKSWDDVIFRDGLADLEAASDGRLRVLHTLTRSTEGAPAGVRSGRLGEAILKEAIPDPSACLVFACGPAVSKWDRQAARDRGEEPAHRFLETAFELLRALGVPGKRIRSESYG